MKMFLLFSWFITITAASSLAALVLLVKLFEILI